MTVTHYKHGITRHYVPLISAVEQLQELGEESEVYTGCSDGCQNGGNCVFPGICECPNGWAGLACEEGTQFQLLT